MGVPAAAGKCGVKSGVANERHRQALAGRRQTSQEATPPLKKKGGGCPPFWPFVAQAARGLVVVPFKSRTRVERQCPVKVLVDVLRLTIRRRVEVRQNGPVLCLRVSAEIVGRSGKEPVPLLPLAFPMIPVLMVPVLAIPVLVIADLMILPRAEDRVEVCPHGGG